MSFADLLAQDAQAIVADGEFSEQVTYRSETPSHVVTITGPKGIVDEDWPDRPVAIGVSATGEQSVIAVTFKRGSTGVPAAINEQLDQITWNGRQYAVKKVLFRDAQIVRLYCAG